MTEHEVAGNNGVRRGPGQQASTYSVLERAQALLDMRRTAEAIDLLRGALATEPHNSRLLGRLGTAYYLDGQLSQALECAQAAAAGEPDWSWPHRLSSIVYEASGRWREAVRAAQVALRCDPHDGYAMLQLADSLTGSVTRPRSKAGRQVLAEARGLIGQAAELLPGSAEPLRSLARIAAKEDDDAGYKELQRKILAIEPMNTDAHTDLVMADVRKGGGIGAGRSLTSLRGVIGVLRADPTHPRALNAVRMLVLELICRFAELFIVATFLMQIIVILAQGHDLVTTLFAVLLFAAAAGAVAYGVWAYRQLPPVGRRRLADFARRPRNLTALIMLVGGAIAPMISFAFLDPAGRPAMYAMIFGYMALMVGYNVLQREAARPRRGGALLVALITLAGLMLGMIRTTSALQEREPAAGRSVAAVPSVANYADGLTRSTCGLAFSDMVNGTRKELADDVPWDQVRSVARCTGRPMTGLGDTVDVPFWDVSHSVKGTGKLVAELRERATAVRPQTPQPCPSPPGPIEIYVLTLADGSHVVPSLLGTDSCPGFTASKAALAEAGLGS